MPRFKVVNGVRSQYTAEEEARADAEAEAWDLDMGRVRSQRNAMLHDSDWTQLGDAGLGAHTAEEWEEYRTLLKDIPQTYSRVSEVVWPEDPPTAKVTRKVTAGNAASLAVIDSGGTPEEAQAAYDVAYVAAE